jgi:hypothetical protein
MRDWWSGARDWWTRERHGERGAIGPSHQRKGRARVMSSGRGKEWASLEASCMDGCSGGAGLVGAS